MTETAFKVEQSEREIVLRVDERTQLVLKRWPDLFGRSTVAGIALGSRNEASSSGWWWQPLVLRVRGGAEVPTLQRAAEQLYALGLETGLVHSHETFRQVAG